MPIRLDANGIFKLIVMLIVFLAACHALVASLLIVYDVDFLFGIAPLFRMDFENNIPTLLTGFIFLGGAVFALTVFVNFTNWKNANAVGWLTVAFVLAFLCIDEVLQIHEKFSPLGRSIMGWDEASGRSAWFVVYAPLPFIVAALLWRWFWNLPRQTQIGFVLAGAVYVFAAVGIELIQVIGSDGLTPYETNRKVWFQLSVLVEESLEMLGGALVLRTILIFIDEQYGGVLISARRVARTG